MKIIIMGGSFNPPTIAHRALLSAALDSLSAEKGLYVPVSYAYLKRKMSQSGSTFCLSEAMRKQMLEAMCDGDERMGVCDLEYGIAAASTFDTMQQIRVMYPNAEMYFLIGADKLGVARRMVERRDFLSHFRIAVFAREGIVPMEEILADPVLAPFAHRFAIVPTPQGMDAVSSTAVRQAVLSGQSVDLLLHPGVAKLLKSVGPEDFPAEITKFQGEYDYLDDLYPAPVEWEGMTYPCVEAAFHASKTENRELRRRFSEISLTKLREKGNMLPTTSQWEEAKRDIRKQLILQKFQANPQLAQKLKDTGNAILICGKLRNKDTYWGFDLYSWEGRNELGKILMEIRTELACEPNPD